MSYSYVYKDKSDKLIRLQVKTEWNAEVIFALPKEYWELEEYYDESPIKYILSPMYQHQEEKTLSGKVNPITQEEINILTSHQYRGLLILFVDGKSLAITDLRTDIPMEDYVKMVNEVRSIVDLR